jgi:hypothetical protein
VWQGWSLNWRGYVFPARGSQRSTRWCWRSPRQTLELRTCWGGRASGPELMVPVSRHRRIRYDPQATDDAATLETLRTLGIHQSEPSPRSDRGLEVLNGLSDKHSAGAVGTETDHVMMTRLLERSENGLAQCPL